MRRLLILVAVLAPLVVLFGTGAQADVQFGTISEFSLKATSFDPVQGIAKSSDGALWFTEFTENRIGRITTSGAVTEFPVPTPRSHPRWITGGPDGNVWFTESTRVARITP